MKKIDLFDKYTTPESWKDAVRSGVREKKEKKRYSISFLPSLQTVLAVVIICVIVGFVARGGIVNLINTTADDSENNGYKPNAGFVGNNAHSMIATEDMTEEELKYAYKAYAESFGITQTEGGYQSFVSEIKRELPNYQQVVITCGLDNAICKRTNIIFTNERGSIPSDTESSEYYAVIIVPIVFEDASSVNLDYFDSHYNLYTNGGLMSSEYSSIDCDMKLKFVTYEELPDVVFAVCKMYEYDSPGTSEKTSYIKKIIESEKVTPADYVAGNFTRDEVNDIYYNGTDLACLCNHFSLECSHTKIKNHEGLAFGVSFVSDVTDE